MLSIEYDGCVVGFECEVNDYADGVVIGLDDDGDEWVQVTKLFVNGVEVDFDFLKEENEQWVNFSNYYDDTDRWDKAQPKHIDDDGNEFILDFLRFNGGEFYIELKKLKGPVNEYEFTWHLLQSVIGERIASRTWGRLLMDGGALNYPIEFVEGLTQAMFAKWKEAK